MNTPNKRIISYLYFLIIIFSIYSFGENNNRISELIKLISTSRNINSIYCTFTQIVDGKGIKETTTDYGELAYCDGNIYYSINYIPSKLNKQIKKNDAFDEPKNLFELLVKKWNENNTENDLMKGKRETIKSYFYQKEGRYIYCYYDQINGEEVSNTCFEYYPYKEPKINCSYLWVTRYNLLHSLGISFLSVGGFYSESDEIEEYYGPDFIPLPKKPIYNSLSITLQNIVQKKHPPDFFKVFSKDNFTILLYNYSTSFWFDKDNNITKITQLNFFSSALKYEEELKKMYSGNITDFLEDARYTYIYSDFMDFPDGVKIPLKIEFIREEPLQDLEYTKLVNNYQKLRSQMNPNSKEFANFEKEYTLNRAILGIKKVKFQILPQITTIIHPESLIINRNLNNEIFKIKIDEDTPIYRNDNFQQPIYSDQNNQNKIDIYSKINFSLFVFITFCIVLVIILIFITKRLLGWGI